MKSVSGKELCRVLERHGRILSRITASHHISTKPSNRVHLSVPVHRNTPLKIGTLRALLRAAELSEEDL